MKVVVCVEGPGLGTDSRAALAAAMKLGDGVEIAAVSAGREPSNGALAAALAAGIAGATQILDPALPSGDPAAIGRVLAAAAKRLESILVLTGATSDGEGRGAVPAAIAHHLGVPIIAHAEDIARDPENVNAVLVTVRGGGLCRRLRVRLPAVISVAGGSRWQSETAQPTTATPSPAKPEVLTLRDLGIVLPPTQHHEGNGALLPFARARITVASADELLSPRG